jgi:hypothetical protein
MKRIPGISKYTRPKDEGFFEKAQTFIANAIATKEIFCSRILKLKKFTLLIINNTATNSNNKKKFIIIHNKVPGCIFID